MPLFLFYNLHIFIGCADKYVGHTSRSSRSQMLFKIGAPKNFANFTGKHLCWSLFLKKVAGLQDTLFIEHLQWLLLCHKVQFFNLVL